MEGDLEILKCRSRVLVIPVLWGRSSVKEIPSLLRAFSLPIPLRPADVPLDLPTEQEKDQSKPAADQGDNQEGN